MLDTSTSAALAPGRGAIITGGASGIGLARARIFESWLSWLLIEALRAELAAAQALAIAEEHGFPFVRNITARCLAGRGRSLAARVKALHLSARA